MRILGSARASRAGGGAPAIANLFFSEKDWFRRGAETSTRGACAPQTKPKRRSQFHDWSPHSVLSACIGSIRVARMAGTKQASAATLQMKSATPL